MTSYNHCRASSCDTTPSPGERVRDDPAEQATTIIDCAGDLAADDTLSPSLRAAAAQTLLDDLARALARAIIDMHAKGQTADQEPPP